MPISTTLPNGQVLTSSALTLVEISTAFQQLTAQMLGLNPQGPNDPAYSQVLIDWPTNGQPGWTIGQDICALGCIPVEEAYGRTRDQLIQAINSVDIQQAIGYTRCWQVSWTFYGPNSFDHARIVKDFLFLDWAHDQLSQSNLYLVSHAEAPRRVPELFQGQWWERTDWHARFYEEVINTVSIGAIRQIEIDLTTPGDTTLEFMASNPFVSNGALTASAVLTSPAIPDGTSVTLTQTITVSGAAAGRPVSIGVSPALPNNVIATAEVTSTNTVTVTLSNGSGQPQTPAPSTYTVSVF